MEATARIRAGITAIVLALVVAGVGLVSSGSGGSTTSSQGLGWPIFVGAVLLVLGVAALVSGLRNRRHERRTASSIPGLEDERTKD
ncbi:hypothetical protein [Actinomycetospora sp. TBRC 11914]|uniref:hypothetical protein n=1 Tax=Actinomycetospora sp. TBRC 11914 TaxID=2729387 RepID=UPI00145D357C|nr:hypothetical protein [Actinomycetospora sp. TBRC 11914]NMO91562.1 hypothetical protein [Actinomycetospora sp. TBRC 11914]